MSYYDQTGQAARKYTDTSQPLLPYPLAGFGLDASIPVVATGVPPAAEAPYTPPGVKLLGPSSPSASQVLGLQNTTYAPVGNRFCLGSPAPGSTLADLVSAWAKAGLFVVVVDSDPLCPQNMSGTVGQPVLSPCVKAVGADYIKNLAGTPGWSVLAMPGSAPSTKANWDAWMSTVGITPSSGPPAVEAGMSKGVVVLGALALAAGAVMVLSPKGSAPLTANRRRGRKHGRRSR